jgi:hypothetical protein
LFAFPGVSQQVEFHNTPKTIEKKVYVGNVLQKNEKNSISFFCVIVLLRFWTLLRMGSSKTQNCRKITKNLNNKNHPPIYVGGFFFLHRFFPKRFCGVFELPLLLSETHENAIKKRKKNGRHLVPDSNPTDIPQTGQKAPPKAGA